VGWGSKGVGAGGGGGGQGWGRGVGWGWGWWGGHQEVKWQNNMKRYIITELPMSHNWEACLVFHTSCPRQENRLAGTLLLSSLQERVSSQAGGRGVCVVVWCVEVWCVCVASVCSVWGGAGVCVCV